MTRVALRTVSTLIALSVGLAEPASAAQVLFANGSAPPDPANVVTAGELPTGDTPIVRNAGCGTPTPTSPCASPGASTTVETNANLNGIQVRDSSHAIWNSGTMNGRFETFDSASLTVTGGFLSQFVGSGDLNGSSSMTVQGGIMDSFTTVFVRNSARLTLETGRVSRIVSDPDTTVTIKGGQISQPGLNSHTIRGHFEMSGGIVYGTSLQVQGSMTLSGGSIQVPFLGSSTSSIVMTGGGFQNIPSMVFNGTLDVFGGSFGSSGPMAVGATGNVDVFGSMFALNGLPISPGELTALSGTLSGLYESGNAFSWQFTRNATGTLRLIPEPGTAWLLGAGLAGLALRRRSPR